MREIKFRGYWQGQVLEVMQIDYRMPDTVILTDGTTDNINVPLENVELMQYTGLKDKNGNEIYEGDIVRYTFDYPSEIATENGLKERVSSVFWSEFRGSWSVYADERKGKGMNNDLFKYVRNGNTVEVIGNIYENYELLEQMN